ncbi:DUF2812 domain-containing protein [Neobacillus notoginsengisoli]|uniref:DUF2812 domain-containing protein n=1 Tax=Neobacillus notoginsengisoli TaxID=1578198 RepID=A0A417YS59_9BACI|nr:DUF2812 domain-containing protein [Neobacillus notoginsengisoli]RHW38126.1 DUF2812 domain-containing protein [Neobacillus notoginsengisoli]
MYKLKFFVDFEKEEKWLVKMANDGYHLQNASFGYRFQKGEPEAATIKIDFRKFKKKEDFIDYCTMFEDSGWKHLAGTKSSGIQYFKKMNDTVDDEIFSDNHSKAARYKRYASMCFELAISYLPILLVFYLTDIIHFKALINPKELYFTPGLWDKEGVYFWFSFLFETPFALMRGLAWSFIPLAMIFYFFFGYRAKKLYLQKR